jgi:hypothetical protein
VIYKFLLTISLFSVSFFGMSQTCPTYSKRNNGNNVGSCHSSDATNCSTSGYCAKTGAFQFSTNSSDFTIQKIFCNNVLLQDGQSVVSGSVFFGAIKAGSGSSGSDMCFYASTGAGGVAPAGNFRFEITPTGGSTITCNYAITSTQNGALSTTTAGTIGSSQTICSGATPSLLTSTTAATNYSSYKWQSSTTSATSGFSDIADATSSTYQPPALTQTTYYQRLAISGSDAFATDAVTITVISAGTISPAAGTTWSGSTQTFASTVSGGTWSVVTSPASGVATIDASTGVLTNTLATNASGSGTVTYTVSSGGTSCTATRTFNLFNNSGTLPVTWETISAQKQNSQVLINWSTASEQNTKDFEVQYSTNTTNWDAIGTIKAAGNSSATRNYSFTHQTPLKNSAYNYYRILQRDLDGKFSYSKIVSIIFSEPGPDMSVYPNPVSDVLTVYLSESKLVRLINAAGAIVWQSNLPAGRNQISVSQYSKGVYVLTAGGSLIV